MELEAWRRGYGFGLGGYMVASMFRRRWTPATKPAKIRRKASGKLSQAALKDSGSIPFGRCVPHSCLHMTAVSPNVVLCRINELDDLRFSATVRALARHNRESYICPIPHGC